MPIVSMNDLLAKAENGGYAVSYCEAWNLESLQAVMQAAEELHSPIIAGFSGGCLIHPGRSKPEELAYYAGLSLGLRKANVPVAFILNETDDLGQISEGIGLGFNAVMVENEHLGPADYQCLVKKVVGIAHAQNASVEAQVGKLANAADGSNAERTDAAAARAFVEDTGIDALGVAVGNVHCLTDRTVPIDLAALERIRKEIRIPLVLHGGSGISPEMAQGCRRAGVAKVNFGTALKQAYLAAVREKLVEYHEPMNPHPFLGMGGPQDILTAGREAVRLKVQEFLRLWGSAGKA